MVIRKESNFDVVELLEVFDLEGNNFFFNLNTFFFWNYLKLKTRSLFILEILSSFFLIGKETSTTFCSNYSFVRCFLCNICLCFIYTIEINVLQGFLVFFPFYYNYFRVHVEVSNLSYLRLSCLTQLEYTRESGLVCIILS